MKLRNQLEAGWMNSTFRPNLVSVIIPTFNRGSLLAEAIDSVFSQTYRPIECVIADADSKDNTKEIILDKQKLISADDDFDLVYVTEADRGASASRNLGLRTSRGEFIQFLDSDDVLVSTKVAHHTEVLKKNANLDVVWSEWKSVQASELQNELRIANDARAVRVPSTSQVQEPASLIPWEPWPSLFRRRLCVAAGPWNEELTRFEDWEYAIRLLAMHPGVVRLPGTYVINREHCCRGVYDHPHRSNAVARGLDACREAYSAWSSTTIPDDKIAQLIAVRYWEMGLEALLLGTSVQAMEGFAIARRISPNALFRCKAAIASVLLGCFGSRVTQCALSRYKYAFTMGGQYSGTHYKAPANRGA